MTYYRPLCVTCIRLLAHPGRGGWGGQLIATWNRPEGGQRRLVAAGIGDLSLLVDVVQEYHDVPDADLLVVDLNCAAAGVLADTITRGEAACRWHIPATGT